MKERIRGKERGRMKGRMIGILIKERMKSAIVLGKILSSRKIEQ